MTHAVAWDRNTNTISGARDTQSGGIVIDTLCEQQHALIHSQTEEREREGVCLCVRPSVGFAGKCVRRTTYGKWWRGRVCVCVCVCMEGRERQWEGLGRETLG